MKLIVNTNTNAVVFALADDCETVFLEPSGDEPKYLSFEQNGLSVTVGDLAEDNTSIVNVDSIPDDFAGCKYLYDADQADPFVLNPDWVDPEPPAE